MMRSITLSSVIVLTVLGAAPALAGFEWVPPADEPAAAPMPSAQDMLATPGGQAWNATPVDNPYAQQNQMMLQQQAMMAAPPAYYPPPQSTGYYAGASAYPNPVPPAPAPTASAGGLNINPYPMVQAGYAPSMMNTGTVEGAMLSESRTMNPLQLGNGMNTGGKGRSLMPSVPAPAPMPGQFMAGQPHQQPQPLALGMNGSLPGMSMSAMPGGPLAPLPGAYPAAPVMQAPVAPPPPPVAAAPLAPPPQQQPRPVMEASAPAPDTAYPAGAPSSTLRPPAATQVAAAAVPGGHYDDAVGFGKDLPLALALSQVIPGDYALFFETAIDAETNVSWQGGKPWNQVLQDMLAPLGLRAVIQPNLVMIRSA